MMIFLTVGLHEQPFDRLVKAVDLLAAGRKIIQFGHARYTPINSRGFKFLSYAQMVHYFQRSDIVITHGGTGSIMLALSAGKKPITAPRYKKYGEHVDDHQIEIVSKLADFSLVVPFYDGGDLSSLLSARHVLDPPAGSRRPIDRMLHKILNKY